jgi:riboflavin biosynthesis pyrimidine reductase
MRRLFPEAADEVDLATAYEHRPGVVRANFVSSLDGSATLDGRSGGLSASADKALFNLLRQQCDVILVGAGTVRTENYGPSKHAPIAVVSGSLALDPAARFFDNPTHRPIVITTATADSARVEALRTVADIVVAGERLVEIPAALDALAERGLTRVLTEGGPTLMAEITARGRLDELALTLAPHIVGGGGKRITDGPTTSPPAELSLAHVLEDDGSLFLLYRRS